MEQPQPQPLPQILSPCSSGRRRSCGTSSPEFEFWMVGNQSFPQPNLLSADELFNDGFLLPLHLLQLSSEPPQDAEATGPDKAPEPEPAAMEPVELSANTKSKRWRHIFKKKAVSSISTADDHGSKEKREKKNGGAIGSGAGNVVSVADLHINIWPFSRSRSAGNGRTRTRAASATRKVSSAPCSRSNSTGESKCRKGPPHSPNRAAGVHLGRNSPVWQVRRGGGRSSEAFVKNAEKGGRRDGNVGRRRILASKATVLSLNVPTCIGYRNHLSCRHDESGEVSIAGGGSQTEGGVSGEVVRRSNLFNIRSLFSKKVP